MVKNNETLLKEMNIPIIKEITLFFGCIKYTFLSDD